MGVLSVFVVFISGVLGYNVSQKYNKRLKFYSALNGFCDYLVSNLSFFKSTIEESFNQFISVNKCKLQNELCSILDVIKNNDAGLNIPYLQTFENEEIERFFKKVGAYSGDVELKRMENFNGWVKKKLLLCEEEKTKKQPLVYKLSIVFGLVVAIILA